MCPKNNKTAASVRRTLGLSSLKKRRLRDHLISLYSFLRRSRQGGIDLFSLGSSDRRHKIGSVLHQGRFRLDIRTLLCRGHVTLEQTSYMLNDPCLSVFERHLDNDLFMRLSCLLSPEEVRQLDGIIIVGPFPPNYFPFFYFSNERL